jgi:hypothetical protein
MGGQGVRSGMKTLPSGEEYPAKHNQFDAEPRKDVLDLLSYIRKYKTFSMMKQVLSDEAHEK